MSERSLKDQRQLVRQRPGDAQAWYALGEVALEAGEVGEARFAFTQSVYLAPNELDRAVTAAERLTRARCHAEAEHILRRVLDRAPDRKDAHLQLAGLLLENGRETEAASELEAALRRYPDDIELRMLAATAHERGGALAEAAQHLRGALAVNSDHLDVNRRLAGVLSRMGDTGGAVRCWRQIVRLTGGQDTAALTGLGISLSDNAQHGEALQILTEVAGREGRSASALADLGMALTAAGRMDEATVAFSRALALDPSSAQAHCGLGIAYERQGKWYEAAQAFRTTEQLAPHSLAGPLNLGLALQELGDREGARRALLRAAALDPNDAETRSALEESFATSDDSAATPAPVTAPPHAIQQGFGASITGDLTSFQLFDVLEFLRLQKKTGSLVVSSRQGAGIVRLAGGAVTSASAPRVKRLGEELVDGGLVARSDLELALAHQREGLPENIEALGSVLLRDKLIDRTRLTLAIRRQVMAALEDMLSWKEGAFSFHPGHAAEGEGTPVSFDLQDVMLKLMRMSDERNAGKPPHLD
jgi:Flp pilus assembly protein TadD